MVFSTMFRRSIQNFPIYYLTGQIFWTLFQTSTTASMTALVDNRNLLLQAKLPKQVFMLSRIYTAMVNFIYTCIAYVLMLLVFQVPLNPVMPLFFVAVIMMVLFSMGIGYALATAYVFFADIRYLYGVFLTFLMYLSAIFYPVDMLPEAMQRVIGVNPVYVMIAFARQSILEGTVPAPIEWVKAVAWSLGSLVVGLLIFKTNENKVMQKL